MGTELAIVDHDLPLFVEISILTESIPLVEFQVIFLLDLLTQDSPPFGDVTVIALGIMLKSASDISEGIPVVASLTRIRHLAERNAEAVSTLHI